MLLTARDIGKAEAAKKSIAGSGTITACTLDVTKAASIKALFDYVTKNLGRADVLVNNAGIMIDQGKSILDVGLGAVQATLDTNLYGPLLLSQTFLPLLRAQRMGRIVNLSSGLGQLDGMSDGNPAYRLSKTALVAMTVMFAAATDGAGVLVNAMCPGWVRTGMGGPGAPRSVEQGAETAVWLAMLPDDGPTGKLFRDKKPIPW